jgi:Tfp pilus assembly protein PilX
MLAAIRRRGSEEQGATLILFSLILVSLLGTAGLVVDIGLVRTDRRHNKSASDVAVAAGLRSLELGGNPAPFRGVCEAVKFLKANQAELAGMTGTYTNGDSPPGNTNATGAIISGDPCSTSAPEWYQLCAPNTKSTWAWYHGTADGGRLAVDVKSGYELSDGAFTEESLVSGDSGDTDLGNCDHLAVIVSESQTPGLGKVLYGGTLKSRVRSVGRVTQSVDETAVIALLLLERDDCNVLTFNGTNSALSVQGNGTHSGIIHADSIGSGDDCSSKILNGATASTSGGYNGPAILAEQAEVAANPVDPPRSGYVSVAAKSGIPGSKSEDYGPDCPTRILAEPGGCVTGSSRKGRLTVDILYRARIAALQAEAETRTGWNQTQAETATAEHPAFTWYPSCGSVPATVTATHVFINCSNFNNAVTFTANNAEVIFNGRISGSQDMTFENPAKIYIRDGLSRSGGTFNVNTGSVSPPASANCAARFPSQRAKTTKLVVANGDLTTTGAANLHLCGTTLLMGDHTAGSGSGCPHPPPPAIPTLNGAFPYDNCFNGYLSLAGGGALDWTAPNRSDAAMDWNEAADAPYLDTFEDLAFWTETAGSNGSISGGGSNTMKGVFFLPNADPFNISGNGGQVIQTDAQFIVRKLKLGGNGVLAMRPNPNNSVSFPYFSGFSLVR